MLRRKVIEPSSSAWSSPIVLVTKKDGSTRFCVDFHKINDVTVKDAYPYLALMVIPEFIVRIKMVSQHGL